MNSITQHNIKNVSVIFLIGNQNSHRNFTLTNKILEESAKFGDILQADMVDHYNNLTLKSVFTLKFFLNESNFEDSKPPFHLMKVDNDVYLNVPQLLRLLEDKKLKRSPMYLVGHRYDHSFICASFCASLCDLLCASLCASFCSLLCALLKELKIV